MAEEKTTSKKKQKSVHSGHRLRVKERFLSEGLENFEPHQVLEMLLFFGVPMKDTNELAHLLLDTFGSVYRVMEASYDDIRKVPGITDNAAVLICFTCQLAKRYWTDRCRMGDIITSSSDIGDYFKYRYIGETVESLFVVSMDNRSKVLNCTRVSKGSVNSSDLNVRKILQIALRDNATRLVLIHNHPNGHALPSTADLIATDELARGLRLADIILVDHIIVSEDDFISLADSKNYANLFTGKYVSKEMHQQRVDKLLK